MNNTSYETLVVTGAGGFIGTYLLRHLQQVINPPGRIVGLDLKPSCNTETETVEWIPCDLTNQHQVTEILQRVKPQGIIHLAGVTGGNNLDAYFSVNVLACRNLLTAVSQTVNPPRVMIIGSAAQYGITSGKHEIVDESRPLLGSTPYGLSKTIQESWALMYARDGKLPVVCVRPFNIMGPGQSGQLVPAAFLHQIADVEAGKLDKISVGNTSTYRDFSDVRDVVAAIWSLMSVKNLANSQVFNIASEKPTKIQDILDACIELSQQDIPVWQDKNRLKAVDVPVIVGDAGKLRKLTGWKCQIDWRQSLKDMWREIQLNSG